MKRFVVVDPSGNFDSGKGTTGICTILYDEENFKFDWKSLRTESIAASKFTERHMYWKTVMDSCTKYVGSNVEFIIESFMVRANGFLMGTMPETIQLIGVLTYELEEYGHNPHYQTPSQAKYRFNDEILEMKIPGFEHRGTRFYLNDKIVNDHIRDALRHLLYFERYTFNKK